MSSSDAQAGRVPSCDPDCTAPGHGWPPAPERPSDRVALCPTRTPEPHQLGEFPMTCYRCHVEADS